MRLRRDPLDRVESRLVWIVGSPRTGTTWLLNLLALHTGGLPVDEPQLGTHLVLFSPDLLGVPAVGFPEANLLYNDWRRTSDDYFFADRYAAAWRPALRRLVLERFAAQARDHHDARVPILVKEPNGSQAAGLLSSLLPASRLLVVWRDGRDVVDSQLDAGRKGAWMDVVGGGRDLDAAQRLDYLGERAVRWVARTKAVQAAVASHDPALTHVLTYEDLLARPVEHLEALRAWLDAPVHVPAAAAVEQLDFARIDPSLKGSGQFARAATPGLWRRSFDAAEQELLHRLMGPTLSSLGYEVP